MDTSWKNLQNQKKYLSNIQSLLRYSPYKNTKMEELCQRTHFTLEMIKGERFKQRNKVFRDLAYVLDILHIGEDSFYEQVGHTVYGNYYNRVYGTD